MSLIHPRGSESIDAFAPPIKEMREGTEMRILLVEDVASDALLIRIALDATGIPYTLSRVQRGDEVLPRLLDLAQREMPDLIMLDLGLPGMDGFEVMETMARMPNFLRAVPIVILTAYRGFEYIDKNYPLLIKKYINKPCNSEEMREVLMGLRLSRPEPR